MYSANDFTRLVTDLSAHWTDRALQVLKAAGLQQISVAMELAAWRTVERILHTELNWQTALRLPTLRSLSALTEQVLNRAAVRVAQRFEPSTVTSGFKTRVRRAAGEQQATPAERQLYAEIVHRPPLLSAFKLPSRTDFVPHLHASTT